MTKPGRKAEVSLLVTDLDNTLWDWFHAWHSSFSAMLHRLGEMSGLPESILEQEIQAVHRERGTSEYSHLLNELPSLLKLHPDREPLAVYDDAMHVLNSVRKSTTKLYPGVMATLRELRDKGVPVVAYTESVAYWTEWRIRATGIDGLIDVLYSSPDHDLPHGVTVNDLRKRPADAYGLKATTHRRVPAGIIKPSAHVLDTILSDYGIQPHQAAYVGDSLMKDVAMAQQVGALDVYARYGVAYHKHDYELLRRVSHWRQEDIDRERALAEASEITPSFTLTRGFAELLDLFEFQRERHG